MTSARRPLDPQPWDWTDAAARLHAWPPGQVHALDDAVAQLRGHLHAAGIRPSAEAAEAMWVGARLTIELLAPLLRYVGDDPAAKAYVIAHIDQVEDICAAARDLWRRPPPIPASLELLATVEQLRDDHTETNHD